MPWKEVTPMEERLLFIADYLREKANFSELCGQYGISRKTGYKWVERYREDGMEALSDRSRRPKSNSAKVPYRVERSILELRAGRDTPGPKKIIALLGRQYAAEEIPSPTTVYNILKKAGQIKERRRRLRVPAQPGPLSPARAVNETWSADYKGQFLLRDGQWCYPLTVMDQVSRYLLVCQGLPGTRYEPTRAAFERLFREYGLPNRIRTDNGTPFASHAVGGLSKLNIWWIRLGIRHERIEKGQPQQNGRHERMHRTLKGSLSTTVQKNLKAQQHDLDAFMRHYNEERPHEGLGQQTPGSQYSKSARSYPRKLAPLEYPDHYLRANVSTSGMAYWRNYRVYAGYMLEGQQIGLEPVGDGLWDVYFAYVRLGQLDERQAEKNGYVAIKLSPM